MSDGSEALAIAPSESGNAGESQIAAAAAHDSTDHSKQRRLATVRLLRSVRC